MTVKLSSCVREINLFRGGFLVLSIYRGRKGVTFRGVNRIKPGDVAVTDYCDGHRGITIQ